MDRFGETKRTEFNVSTANEVHDPVRAAIEIQNRTAAKKSVQKTRVNTFMNKTKKRIIETDLAEKEKELALKDYKEEKRRAKTDFENAVDKVDKDYALSLSLISKT